jgi:hypothetical protein
MAHETIHKWMRKCFSVSVPSAQPADLPIIESRAQFHRMPQAKEFGFHRPPFLTLWQQHGKRNRSHRACCATRTGTPAARQSGQKFLWPVFGARPSGCIAGYSSCTPRTHLAWTRSEKAAAPARRVPAPSYIALAMRCMPSPTLPLRAN